MRKIVLTIFGTLLAIAQLMGQNIQVTGVVTDDQNKPMTGATVRVQGTTIAINTNSNGRYTITAPSDGTLQFSFVGMAPKEVSIAGKSTINISLSPSTTLVDDVIVIAYGTAKKTTFTGSGSEIKGSDIENAPVSSFEQVLQGAAPGVNVTASSGQPGANRTISIRGIGSINAGNAPLYVVDGIPIMSGNISQSGVTGSSGSLGLSNLININDIETITVLKDASAAAMYGSQGANGVILITTKRGKAGKLKVNFKGSYGISDWAVDNRPYVNGDQMRELWTESLANYFLNLGDTEEVAWADATAIINANYAKPANGYSNWEKELFRDNGTIQEYEVSLTGGNDNTKFYASLNYRDEQGMVSISKLGQYTGRINVTHRENNFLFGANLSVSKMENEWFTEGGSYSNPYYATRTYLLPTIPIYNADGTFYTGSLLGTYSNLVQDFGLDTYSNSVFNSATSIWGEYEFFKGFRFKQTLSYDFLSNDVTTNWPSSSGNGVDHGGLTIKIVPRDETLYSSSILTYDWKICANHNFSALAGWDVSKINSSSTQAVGKGFAIPELKELASAATPMDAYSNRSDDNMVSFISRLNYNFKEKYYLSGTYRRDASSRFGANTRWGDFWSVSGAWRMKEENFLKDVEWVNNLKIRASYGVSGTLPNSLYGHLATYSFSASYLSSPGSVPSRIANVDMSWEKNYALDFGIEARLLNALTLEIDLYNRDTKDLLLNAPVSRTTGFASTLRNVGEMNNKGIEINVSYDVFYKDAFKWTTGLAFGYNKNEVVKLTGGADIITGSNIAREGESYYSLWTREFAGVDPATGEEQWYTNKTLADGSLEKVVTKNPTQASRIVAGKALPDFTGGWRNSLSWKGIELSALASFSVGADFFDNGWASVTNGLRDLGQLGIPNTSQLKRWQNPGDDSGVGKRTYNYIYGSYTSTKWVHSADHIRLKNVTLSYSFPSKLISKANIAQLKVFVAGNNLLTIAATDGFDPEVPITGMVGYEIPQTKSVIFGIEIGF